MTTDLLWNGFCQWKGIDEQTPHDAWCFGGGYEMADELAYLVIVGKKQEASSAYDQDNVPCVGDHSVIFTMYDEAVCVIRNTNVEIRDTKDGAKEVVETFEVLYVPEDYAVTRLLEKYSEK